MSTEARLILAHGTNVAAGLFILVVILGVLIGLPTLVGMAVTVGRRAPEGRWQAVGIGAIVSVCIAFVAGTAFKVNILLLALIAIGGGALAGAAIGGVVRLIRRK